MAEGSNYRDDVFSREVRAGKRKYFFDVKTTRGNDLFMLTQYSKWPVPIGQRLALYERPTR